MRKLSLILLALAIGILFSGCRTAAIYNVDKSSIPSSHKQISLEDTKKAIMRAGGSLGWVMEDINPGYIRATLNLRDHLAVTDIRYSEKEYSLNYANSRNLKYNPTHNTIHKNYNSWIQNLDNAILAQLNLL